MVVGVVFVRAFWAVAVGDAGGLQTAPRCTDGAVRKVGYAVSSIMAVTGSVVMAALVMDQPFRLKNCLWFGISRW
jgi:hypothetical protein